MSFTPGNILIIDFGQMGDVIASLPALRAVREKYPQSRITVATGKSCAAVVELSGYADEIMPVDRVALRDDVKLFSLFRIGQFALAVRRQGFDFVIDLHSLSETNILGYLSGAPHRLYSRRPGRSLDFLSNFRPPPPVDDPRKHITDRYLEVLLPLGIKNADRVPRLTPRPDDERAVAQVFRKEKVEPANAPLVGLFPGAGHPSRRWPLERFAELADMLARNDGLRTLVFAGPEERELVREIRASFPRSTVVFDRFTVPQLVAALARLSVFVSNDTGPVHLAAAVGTPVVVIYGQTNNVSFTPIGDRHRPIHRRSLAEITTDEIYSATRAILTAERTASLFAS